MSEIKALFLALTRAQEERKGHHIILVKALQWLGITRITKKDMDYAIKLIGIEECSFPALNKQSKACQTDVILISDYGFKKLCITSKYPKSKEVRMYYNQLNKDYNDALNRDAQTNLRQLEALDRNTRDLLEYRYKQWYWGCNNSNNEKKSEIDAKASAIYEAEEMQEQLEYLNADRLELQILERKFLKPVYVIKVENNEYLALKNKARKSRGDIRYKMEKYMPREKVIELGLQTESEDELDNDLIDENDTYYTLKLTKPSNACNVSRIIYLPRKGVKSGQKSEEDFYNELVAQLNKETTPVVASVWNIDLRVIELHAQNILFSELGIKDVMTEISIEYQNYLDAI